jgi:hypothetical protein
MKKLLLSAVILCAAVAVQAGDSKTEKAAKAKDSSACCSASKCTDQTKAGCCSNSKMTAKESAGKLALLCPNAAAELGK